MINSTIEYPPMLKPQRLLHPESLKLDPKQADKRGQTSEKRLQKLLSNPEYYSWIKQVQPAKRYQPAYDITVQLTEKHTLSKNLPTSTILVDAKSSQRQIIEYTNRHETTENDWKWVLHCGPSLDDQEINAQIVLYLLLSTGVYDDKSKWYQLFDHLHKQLIIDFESDYSTLCYWGYPIIQWMSKKTTLERGYEFN